MKGGLTEIVCIVDESGLMGVQKYKGDAGISDADKLSKETKDFITGIEEKYRVPVKWVSTGPYLDQAVFL